MDVSQIIVALLGLLVGLLSLWGIVATGPLLDAVDGVMDKAWGMSFAVVVRIILGVALLFAAPASKFPVLFNWLGVVALIAAVALPVLGRVRLRSLLAWFRTRPNFIIRLWLVFGALFGFFLVYGAAIPLG